MSTREDYLQSEQPPVYPDGFSDEQPRNCEGRRVV